MNYVGKRTAMLLAALTLAVLAGPARAAERPLLWWDLQHPGWYINGYNDPDRDIWEVRNDAELLRQRLGRPKRLALRCSAFPNLVDPAVSSLTLLQQARTWLQRPDGRQEEVALFAGQDAVTVEVPEEGAPEGVYLLGAHLEPGRLDVDGDGRVETVHLYGKFLLRHVRESLSHGGEQNVFFNSPRMPLEIGPVRAGRYSGIIQVAHRPCEMAVYYRGRPLAGAEVTILTERGWRKTLRTDANGRFMAVPHETRGDKRNWETFLYVARHHDRQRGEYHCASMPMLVDPPWPEWTHCLPNFVLWSFAGTAFAVLLVAVLVWRRRRRSRLRLARLAAEKCPGGPTCA